MLTLYLPLHSVLNQNDDVIYPHIVIRCSSRTRHNQCLLNYSKQTGERVDESVLHNILMEVDINKNGEIDIGEFLQVIPHRMTSLATSLSFPVQKDNTTVAVSPTVFLHSAFSCM